MPKFEVTKEQATNLMHRPHLKVCIAAKMYWPNDETKQTNYRSSMEPQIIRFMFKNKLLSPSDMSPDHMIEILDKAIDARSERNLFEMARKRRERGFMVGAAVLDVLGHEIVLGTKLTMKTALDRWKNRVGEKFKNTGIDQIQKSVWTEFRPIAPWWAAHIVLFEQLKHENPDYESSRSKFPYPESHLLPFIALVNDTARMSAKYSSPHRGPKRPLISDDEAWQFDCKDFDPGPAKLHFQPRS